MIFHSFTGFCFFENSKQIVGRDGIELLNYYVHSRLIAGFISGTKNFANVIENVLKFKFIFSFVERNVLVIRYQSRELIKNSLRLFQPLLRMYGIKSSSVYVISQIFRKYLSLFSFSVQGQLGISS